MTFKAKWEKEEVYGTAPPPRTSHTSIVYKQNYLITIGGEGFNDSKNIQNLNQLKLDQEKIALNDVWMYNAISKFWSQIKVPNQDQFEGRFCHSATLIGDRIYIYGGTIYFLIHNLLLFYDRVYLNDIKFMSLVSVIIPYFKKKLFIEN